MKQNINALETASDSGSVEVRVARQGGTPLVLVSTVSGGRQSTVALDPDKTEALAQELATALFWQNAEIADKRGVRETVQ